MKHEDMKQGIPVKITGGEDHLIGSTGFISGRVSEREYLVVLHDVMSKDDKTTLAATVDIDHLEMLE